MVNLKTSQRLISGEEINGYTHSPSVANAVHD